MAKFVDAYDKRTGRKHSVPAHWFDSPVLSRNIRKTPLSEKQQRDAEARSGQATTSDSAPASGDNPKE